MTKIKDLVEKYGDREIDEFELEKLLKPEKVKTIYNLEVRDIYWFIDEFGKVINSQWDNDVIDNCKLKIGNVFLTKEDAEFALEYRKVKAELKRYASMCEEPIDWDNGCAKYYLYYYDELHINPTYFTKVDNIYFTDKSILEKAIKAIGEERIIKYYLGVKGENK